MDFIERIFGIAPDGGDGSLEALWILAILVAATAWISRRRLGAWLAGRSTAQASRPRRTTGTEHRPTRMADPDL